VGPARRAIRELQAGYWAVAGRGVDFTPQPLGRNIDPNGLAGYYSELRHKTLRTIDGLPVNSY
jgi:hypothetical protein